MELLTKLSISRCYYIPLKAFIFVLRISKHGQESMDLEYISWRDKLSSGVLVQKQLPDDVGRTSFLIHLFTLSW